MTPDTMLVRIVKDWKYPEGFFLQTPNGSAQWNDVRFTEEPIATCDYLIVLQRPPYEINVDCPAGNAWLIMQEPPVKYFKFYLRSIKYFDKVFTYYQNVKHPCVKRLQPVLPWHVLKSYDELIAVTREHVVNKKDELVWITSSREGFPGHQARLRLKDYLLKQRFQFHLLGHGFKFIHDKFDGLFPNKYALAIENYSTDHYWTEKLADCFLSWCLPFYWGAGNLEEYFPENSFIRININKPEEALSIIQKAIEDREWEKRVDAIEKARNLVLNEYQFFPYIAKMIKEDLLKGTSARKGYRIPPNPYPRLYQVVNQFKYYKKRITHLLSRRNP
jgi:hypothetical protein